MKFYVLRQLLICCLLVASVACDTSTHQPLRIAHNSWPGYEPLPLGEMEDLYVGVDVINFRVGSATEAIRAFEQDIVDVVAVTLDEAIAYQSRCKDPVYIIAILDISHGGDVIIAKKNIDSIDDLKGKHVGLESTALGAFFIYRAVDFAPELSMEQLKVKPILYDQHFSAFMSGDVDAIVTFEPVKSKILKNKGHVIFDSTVIENEIIDVLITKRSTAEKKSTEIKGLVAGYFKALELIKNKPDESISKMAGFEGVSKSEFNKSLSGIRVPDKAENHKLLSGKSPELITTINKLQDFLKKNKIITNNIDATAMITSKYLPE